MIEISRQTRVISGVSPEHVPFEELLATDEPAILKGLARDWPLVSHGRESIGQAVAYLRRFCNAKPTTVYCGEPGIRGRFSYNEQFTGFNFTTLRMSVSDCLDRLMAHWNDPQAPSFYAGSTDVDTFLPGLRAENDLVCNQQSFGGARPTVSIWIGNRTIATAHFDQSHNLACGMLGRRRFHLFPPDQIHNLYPGPLDPTPGGQVVSLVDFAAPDFARFPRFREAIAAGQVAELEPGDALFYPALWWHHVEALEPVNAMINYWWNPAPGYLDSPHHALLHALLSLRDRPEREKRAWRELFDYYVFGPADRAASHLPVQARGNLGPMDENKARRLRAFLLGRLNR